VDELDVRQFLMTEYPRIVAGLALATGNRAVAEDAVQEALARAWERSERGQRIESLGAWVTVVATNLTRSAFRRRMAERRARARLRGSSGGATSAGSLIDAEERADVERALATLSRRQREAVVLRYYLDLSVVEVAAALGVSEGTAKTTLFRARVALSRALSEDAHGAEEANDHAER